MRPWITASITASVALFATAAIARANLVTNGDFATGDLTGWSVFHGDQGTTPVGSNESQVSADSTTGNPAASGLLNRVTTTAADNKDFIYQLVPVTPGSSYTLNADWQGNLKAGGTNRNWAEVYVAFFPTGTTITDATQLPDADIVYKKRWDGTTAGNLNIDLTSGAWTWESILNSPDTSAKPGPTDGTFTATDALMLVGFNIGGRAGSGPASYNIDNVSLTPAAATPEPASLAIAGVASGLLFLRRRRTA